MTVRSEYRRLFSDHRPAPRDYSVDGDEQVRALALAMRPDLMPAVNPAPIAVDEVFTEALPIEGLTARIYRPAVTGILPIVVYVHGGGWIGGNLESVDENSRVIANQAECLVINVEYRLAPEFAYPTALDDVWSAIEWVLREAGRLGGDPRRVALAGNSAGGNLVAAATMRARERGAPHVVAQALVYPALDASMSSSSFQSVTSGPFLTGPQMAFFWRAYLGHPVTDADLDDPEFSPLAATDFALLPPAIIVTAEHDPLCDEGEEYARRLAAAGVPVTWRRYAGQVHGFVTMSRVTGDAHHATVEVAERLRLAFDLDGFSLASAWNSPGWNSGT